MVTIFSVGGYCEGKLTFRVLGACGFLLSLGEDTGDRRRTVDRRVEVEGGG